MSSTSMMIVSIEELKKMAILMVRGQDLGLMALGTWVVGSRANITVKEH